MSRTGCAGAALGAVLSAACGSNFAGTLEGSLTEIMPDLFDFRDGEVQFDPKSSLAVAYFAVRDNGPDASRRDTVFKIVVRLAQAPLDGQTRTADLAPDFDEQPKATVSRNVREDPRSVLAPIKAGTFAVDSEPEVGKSLGGHFRVTFGMGGDAGQGRTAFGTFWAREVQVPVVPP